ncbi:MAG: hypothetical protein MR639_09655 [Clostridium sp.]|uniref:hypothetical protein n=1 Tax=Clostridium sp. TaxID=1506 RepID=UPI002A8DA1A7|nr:hypothetical protein [Clostridium sp.]MDY5099455.1 hypothetical protein [Clostridium sp.]
MKKKVLLICTVAILILFVPLYESYSYKQEASIKAEQLEKDFIDEFYTNAKLEYTVYKKMVDSYPNIEIIKSEDILDQINRNKMEKIIKDSENLNGIFNISRIDKMKKYHSMWSQAHTIYLEQLYLKDKSRTSDFNEQDKKNMVAYLSLIDEVIENYDLPPIASN